MNRIATRFLIAPVLFFLCGCTSTHTKTSTARSLSEIQDDPSAGSDSLDKRKLVAADFGGMSEKIPPSVFFPTSYEEIVSIVKNAANDNRSIKVRGKGHTLEGQSMTDRSSVVVTEKLNNILKVADGQVVVQAGARWKEVISLLYQQGLALKVLGHFAGQSIGGLLSTAGTGRNSHREGMVIDNVLELKVVTAKGELTTCSPKKHSDLFNAVLGGFGQFGIIVEATLPVISIKKYLHSFSAVYLQQDEFLRDLMASSEGNQYYDVYGVILPPTPPSTKEAYFIVKTKEAETAELPDPKLEFAGYKPFEPTIKVDPYTYEDYVREMDKMKVYNPELNGGEKPQAFQPWLDVFVPAKVISKYIDAAKKQINFAEFEPTIPHEKGDFVLLASVKNRGAHDTSITQVPSGSRFYVFTIIQATTDRNKALELAQRNMNLLRLAYQYGGKNYAIDNLPEDMTDWRPHFGKNLMKVKNAKKKFDPKGVFEGIAGLQL